MGFELKERYAALCQNCISLLVFYRGVEHLNNNEFVIIVRNFFLMIGGLFVGKIRSQRTNNKTNN